MRDKCVFMTCCDTRQPPDTRGAHTGPSEKLYNHGLIKCVVYVKALLGAFNQEKALVGAFSMIVKASPMVRLHNHITFSLRLPRYPRIYKPRTCIFLCVNKYGPYNCVMESVGASGKWKTTFLSKYLSYHYKIKLSVDIPDME